MGLEGAERVDGLPLLDEPVIPQFAKDVLDDFGLLRGWSSAEDIKFDFEPVVDAFVNGMVFGTQGFRIYTFLECLGFRSGAIFVLMISVTLNRNKGGMTNRATDEQCLGASCFTEASKCVCRKHTPYQIAEMRDIIHVR